MVSRRRKKAAGFLANPRQKQVMGVLILLLIFIALCYTILFVSNEGLLNLPFGHETPVSNATNTSNTTTVTVIYTGSNNSS